MIVTVSQLINFGLPILTFPLLVKALDITQYGIWIEAGTVIGLAIAFGSYGLTNAVGTILVSQPDKDKHIYSNGLYVFLVLCGGIGLIVAALAPVINRIMIHQPAGVIVIQLSAVTILTGSLNQLSAQIYRVRNQPLRGAIFDIALAISRLLAVVLVAVQRNLIVFAAVYASVQALITLAQVVVAYRDIPLQKPSFSVIRQVIKYGANLAIASQASWLVMFGDRLMLSILSTSESVAIYSASYQMTLILVALGAPYSYPVLPILGERWAANDVAGAQAVIRRSIRATSILLIPAVFGLSFIGSSLLKVLATEKFVQSGLLVAMIGLGVGLDVIGVNLQYLFFAQGRPDILRWIYVRAAGFNLAANLLAIPLLGYYGAGLITLLTFVFIIFALWRNTGMPLTTLFDLSTLVRCAAASTVMGIWVLATGSAEVSRLLVAIGGGAVIYGLMILMFRVISVRDLIMLIRLLTQRLQRLGIKLSS